MGVGMANGSCMIVFQVFLVGDQCCEHKHTPKHKAFMQTDIDKCKKRCSSSNMLAKQHMAACVSSQRHLGIPVPLLKDAAACVPPTTELMVPPKRSHSTEVLSALPVALTDC